MSQQTDQTRAEEKPRDSIWDILRIVIYALLIALVFRTFVFQPFSIPSGSMKPTLLIGDYLFVSKYSYGYSRYSIPFGRLLPESVFGGRLFGGEPERGDVIVFRSPRHDDIDYIKRVVGLPGDRVRIASGVIFINGEPVDLERAGDFVEPLEILGPGDERSQACTTRDPQAGTCAKTQFVETLPTSDGGSVRHFILDANGPNGFGDNWGARVIPEDHFLFIGDNRDNSRDGRFDGLGLVHRDFLIGRAEIVVLSSDGAFWQIWNWRFSRFLNWVD